MNLLFVAPLFYRYEQKILNELINQKFVVDFVFYDFNSELKNKKESKGLKKLNEKLNNHNYDFLFVIKGNVLTSNWLKQFSMKNVECKKILYSWDSFQNSNIDLKILKQFDVVYSFDTKDVNYYSEHNIRFKPLFYLDDFRVHLKNNFKCKFDISFIGRFDDRRVELVNLIKQKFPNYKYKILLKTGLGRKILNKILNKPLNFYLPNIILSSVSLEKTSKILQKTSIILDVPHHNQSGLTIRTFEAIGLNKKLITTNENVKNYDFYNSNNIFIVNKGNIHLLDNFIRLPYIKLSDAIYKKYSISNWVKSFFFEENISYFN